MRNSGRARAQFPGRGKADYREFLPNFAGRAGRGAGGHGAHRVFCFPVRLEGAHIARSGTLCREGAARRRLQPAMVAKSPDARHWGKLCGLLQKASKEKAMCALCPPAPRRDAIRARLRHLRETKQRQGARGKKSSAPICGICGKQNRGKEQEARNHPRKSAKSAGNHLQSEI